MKSRIFRSARSGIVASLTAVGLAVLLLGCSGDDQAEDGLTRSDVEEVVASVMSETAEPAVSSEPAVSPSEVEQAVETAVADLRDELKAMADPQAESGMTADEVQRLARLAIDSIPPKTAPSEYTQDLIERAVERYDLTGREATIAHFSTPDSIDGQWYVFMVDEDDKVIAHPDRNRIGLDLKGPVGTDVNGYEFGQEMLDASEEGKWVPYFYANPQSGSLDDSGVFELKNAWVVRHDGVLFGSGWYINFEEFLPEIINESVTHFREGGLAQALEYYNDPLGISTGFIPAAEYYNSTETLGTYFSGFIAEPSGTILAHIDSAIIGTDIVDLLGPAVRNATRAGTWITAADNPAGSGGPSSMRVWVVNEGGTLIGGGWYSD